MCHTTSDLSRAEEVSALALCNMVLCVLDKGAERLDKFREHRYANKRGGGVGEASSVEVPLKEKVEEESMGENDGEEEGHEEDDEDTDDEYTDDEDRGEENESHSSSGSMQESPRSTCCYSDRYHCPLSWAE